MSYQQSEAPPSPEAIHLRQSGFTHPKKLVFNGREPIFGVVLGSTDQLEKLPMKLGCRGSDNLKIGEQSIGGELFGNLNEQTTFALVFKVMNRETRYHHIESAKRRQRVLQIPLANVDPVVARESISSAFEHRRRRIYRYDALHTCSMLEYESGKPAIAATQVEHRGWRIR